MSLVAGSALLGACSESKLNQASEAFCVPYLKIDEKLTQTTTTDPKDRAEAQLPLFKKLRGVTPENLKKDLELIIQGYESVLAGDPPTASEAQYEAASRRLNRYGSQGCHVYDRKGSI